MDFLPKNKFFKTQLAKDIALALLIVLLFEVLGGALTLLQTPEYRAQAKVLIIQKQLETHDVFSSTKASEQLAQDLSIVISTTAFLNGILADGFLKGDLVQPGDDRKPLAVWQESVTVEVPAGTAIISLTSYAASPARATALVDAAYLGLLHSGVLYHGGGDQVLLKTLDPPSVSDKPVRPDYLINFIVTISMGVITAFLSVHLRRHYRKVRNKKMQLAVADHEETADAVVPIRPPEQAEIALSYVKKESDEPAILSADQQKYFFELASGRERQD
jgi:capsular polysaccharide biosynthesis protein